MKKIIPYCFFLLLIIILGVVCFLETPRKHSEEKIRQEVIVEQVAEPVAKEAVEKEIIEEPVIVQPVVNSIPYRLTSFVGYRTGSGKSTSDFEVNDKGWYTYNGALVLAAATKECLYTTKDPACTKYAEVANRHYFKYYDKLKIEIDNITYDAIILDSCGACMSVTENRLDIFISDPSHKIDRGYRGNNMTKVTLGE